MVSIRMYGSQNKDYHFATAGVLFVPFIEISLKTFPRRTPLVVAEYILEWED